jgi:hypothetical protein
MSTKKKQPRETLFPLPRNRTRKPTDAESLLHALAIGIRDHATHDELRKLICHLPKVMNRVTPFNATEQHNCELMARIGELEAILRKMLARIKRQTAQDIALAGQLAPEGAKSNT